MNTITELLQRLGVVFQAENRVLAVEVGLQAVHIDVLRYLSRCNRYSNTPAAVGKFLNSTKGTVSQSVKVLEREKLISKLSDAQDGRVVRLRLLKKGASLLRNIDEQSAILAATRQLGVGESKALAGSLTELLRRAQIHNESRSFGVCKTCRFFTKLESGGFQCGVTKEPLSTDDSSRICVEHENANSEL